MDLELQSHLWTDLCMNLYWNGYRYGPAAPELFFDRFAYEFILKLIQKWTWSSRAIFIQICVWICIEFDTGMDLELHIHFYTDLCMNLYWNWYRNGPGAPEPFVDRFVYEFVWKWIQKWTWSSRAIGGQICVLICIEIDTEMDLELQSPFWIDLLLHLYWNWYRNGPGAPEPFVDRFAYELVLKLVQKWTWSSRAIFV